MFSCQNKNQFLLSQLASIKGLTIRASCTEHWREKPEARGETLLMDAILESHVPQ